MVHSRANKTDLVKARAHAAEARWDYESAQRRFEKQHGKLIDRDLPPGKNKLAIAAIKERDGWKLARLKRRVEKFDALVARLEGEQNGQGG